MGNRNGLIIIGVFVALLMGGALYWASVTKPPPPEAGAPASSSPSASKPEPPTGVKVQGAVLEEKGPDGQLVWRVTADADLKYSKDTNVVSGEKIKFVALQKGKTPVSLTAASFTADYPKRQLVFEQGVKGQLLPGGASFLVNRLEYQFANKKMVGTGGIKFIQGAYRVTADQLVVDTARHKVRLSGHLRFVRSE